MKRVASLFKKNKPSQESDGNATASNDHANGNANGYANGNAGGSGNSQNQSSVSRDEVQSTLSQYAQLIHAARRPLPTQSGDGTYLENEVPSGLMEDLRSLGFKDVNTVIGIMKNKVAGGLTDDKTYLMEHIIQLVAALPTTSKTRSNLTNAFLDELWSTLQHPPLSYLGDKYTYRQADGSYNNILFPQIGAANTPYARSVIPQVIQPGALPDPGLVFDSVLARRKFTPHPNRVSSVFFYWASIIIHDLFQTDHRDISMSQTSSYLDLAPLYGDNQEDQNNIRTFKDGKLKPDCFSEPRLLGFPPGCGVLLIMMNRFHNYVVEQLAAVNEHGRFTKPSDNLSSEAAEKAWAKYDNDLFQTGRLVTCGLYINITLLDYLRTIVNLNRSNTTWTLDPRVNIDNIFDKDGTPRGIGNQVSVEFNLAYRWHSATSDRDDKWTQEKYKELFGKPADEISMQELLMGLGKWEKALPVDPSERSFAYLKRQADGKFNDDDLVKIISESIEDTAGSFGANNVPLALRSLEILGMEQARKWNCATLNEFRRFFGLKGHDTFEEINSDPEVASKLRHLYEHPEYVELYPGLVAEEAKTPMVPGVGIAPTYTVSRAVLSDAVALVRGDRFYTIDYNAKSLTNWGYTEVLSDLSINQGCVIYKLFLRAFPNHFKQNSIYAHYPMTIPSENRKIMATLGRESDYSYEPPAPIPPRIFLTSYTAAKTVLENGDDFKVLWGEAMGFCMGKGGLNFMLSGDGSFYKKQREVMGKALYQEQWHKQVKEFYESTTLKLLQENAYQVGDGINMVDITRDIINIAHTHFAASVFSLPMKTDTNPHGIYSPHELYQVLSLIFVCVFFDMDPAKSFPLRQAARAVSQQLGKLVEANVKAVDWVGGKVAEMVGIWDNEKTPLKDYGSHMVKRLLESGLSAEEVAWSQVLPTGTAMVANQAQVFTQLIDYYLSPAGQQHLPHIRMLAQDNTPESDNLLLHYAMEGIRLNGTFGSYRTSQTTTTITDYDASPTPSQNTNAPDPISIKPSDRIFISFVSTNHNPTLFPSPETVRLDRPLDSYIHYGIGPHSCLGGAASQVALTAMLRVIGGLKNLRRAPGPAGELKKIMRPGGFYVYMREDWGGYWPFPTSLKICWDGEVTGGSGKGRGV